MIRKTHSVDATNITLGRLATKVAGLLMGKHKPDYQPYSNCGDMVEVKNISALKFDAKRLATIEHKHHTFHPGGLKMKLAKDFTPAQLLRRAVNNMLPKNKLRDQMLKRLTIE
ncbi:MAG: 50S ribosomal protein L13 [Patescibacteria group bacterium]